MKKMIAMLLACMMLIACTACAAKTETAAPAQDASSEPAAAETAAAETPAAEETEAASEEAAQTAADSDVAYVQANGKLVVGITDFAPMDYQDENGEWIGQSSWNPTVRNTKSSTRHSACSSNMVC